MKIDRKNVLRIGVVVAAMGLLGPTGPGMAPAMAEPGGPSPSGERAPDLGSAERGPARDGQGAHGPKERGPRQGDQGDRGAIRALFEGVDLTDSQKDQVRELMLQARDERRAWMEEHGEELRELRERMADARAVEDIAAMQAIGQEARAIMSGGPQPMAVAEDVRSVLTEAQAERFDANLERVQARMQERRASGRPGEPRSQRPQATGLDGDQARQRGERPGDGEARRGPGRAERGARGDLGDLGERGDRGPRGERGSQDARGERGERRGQRGDDNGIDREAIRERLERFRERREARDADGVPAVRDDMFSDDPQDAATQPASEDADDADGQLDL
jgi:Spy/CpxP family protein refolding chaperone